MKVCDPPQDLNFEEERWAINVTNNNFKNWHDKATEFIYVPCVKEIHRDQHSDYAEGKLTAIDL